jgi:hypothetical protein
MSAASDPLTYPAAVANHGDSAAAGNRWDSAAAAGGAANHGDSTAVDAGRAYNGENEMREDDDAVALRNSSGRGSLALDDPSDGDVICVGKNSSCWCIVRQSMIARAYKASCTNANITICGIVGTALICTTIGVLVVSTGWQGHFTGTASRTGLEFSSKPTTFAAGAAATDSTKCTTIGKIAMGPLLWSSSKCANERRVAENMEPHFLSSRARTCVPNDTTEICCTHGPNKMMELIKCIIDDDDAASAFLECASSEIKC